MPLVDIRDLLIYSPVSGMSIFFWRCWPVSSPKPSNLIQYYSTGNPPIEKDNIAEDKINLVIKPVEINLLLIWKPHP